MGNGDHSSRPRSRPASHSEIVAGGPFNALNATLMEDEKCRALGVHRPELRIAHELREALHNGRIVKSRRAGVEYGRRPVTREKPNKP